jgi:hypothetical protein
VRQPEFKQDMLFYGFTRDELVDIIRVAHGNVGVAPMAMADFIIEKLEGLASG